MEIINGNKGHTACEVTKGGPCGYVIFGASGDLAARKLIPSLFSAFAAKRIPENFFVAGFGRSENNHEKFRNYAEAVLLNAYPGADRAKTGKFLKRLFYVTGTYDDIKAYEKLKDCFDSASVTFNTLGNGIFHLAVPPSAYSVICRGLSISGLVPRSAADSPYRRIIIEKPFGRDIQSARALQEEIEKYYDEKVIYRIDHYMGKEAIQNMLVFRFGNSIFGPLWNKSMIDSVQITVAETETVGHRGEFFDKTGLLRDMLQSHMLLLSAVMGIEPPRADADFRLRTCEFIRNTGKIPSGKSIIRGRYEGYENEQGVSPDSCTETMFALKLTPERGPLAGVPFYLRAGKALSAKETKVTVVFRENDSCVMCGDELARQPNILTFGIHPKQEITLTFMAKSPGSKMCTMPVPMHFSYAQNFGGEPLEDYANLILSCMEGDQTFFWKYDSVIAAWQAIEPVIKEWEACPLNEKTASLIRYARGSGWPEEITAITASDGRKWE